MRATFIAACVVAATACARNDGNLTDASMTSHDASMPSLDAMTSDVISQLSLTVTIAGAGTVTSTPAGISCTTASCAAAFDQGTVVTLTAVSSTGSVFGGWSGGGCAGAALTCDVTLAQAASVTATFEPAQYALTVTRSGTGSGTVAGNGIDCGGTCSVMLSHGTVITLSATESATAATLSGFTGWSGAGCSGSGGCSFTITESTTVDASFELKPNLMFTTSATYDGNLGGLAGADAKCQSLAAAKGLAGTYRAYLGATGTNAPSRFAGASGWTRVDGAPLVNAIGDFGTTTLANAPVLDQSGTDLSNSGQVMVWTATTATTLYLGTNCNNMQSFGDWNTNMVAQTQAGICTATNASVIAGASLQTCASLFHLYCFGIDRAASL